MPGFIISLPQAGIHKEWLHAAPIPLIRKACQGKAGTGILEIHPETRVSELENAFWERFQIRAQVFRKTGSIWLEANDGWILEVQNKYGRESAAFSKRRRSA